MAGADPNNSISQVLQTLGLTREDLLKHSAQMRQFLTDSSSLVNVHPSRSNLNSSAESRQHNLVKEEGKASAPRTMYSKSRVGLQKDRNSARPPSSSPTRAGFSLDSFMLSRDSRRAVTADVNYLSRFATQAVRFTRFFGPFLLC